MFLFLFTPSFPLLAQDESFYRKIFTNDLYEKINQHQQAKIVRQSKNFLWDFDRDGNAETFGFKRLDGVDYFKIYTSNGLEALSVKLPTMGAYARPIKIIGKKLSKQTDVYLLHYFQGQTRHGQEKQSVAKILFITLDNNELATLDYYTGPSYWVESNQYKNRYRQRYYRLLVEDLDANGVKEVSLLYGQSSQVYFYRNKGQWTKL